MFKHAGRFLEYRFLGTDPRDLNGASLECVFVPTLAKTLIYTVEPQTHLSYSLSLRRSQPVKFCLDQFNQKDSIARKILGIKLEV